MPVDWEDRADQVWVGPVVDTTIYVEHGLRLRAVEPPESRWWHPFTWYHAARMWRLRRRFRRAARRDRATWAA